MKNLLLLFAVFFCLQLHAQEDTTYKPVETPEGFTRQIDVVYTKVKDWEGKLDIYMPPKKDKPTPIVINIHGGGWNKGVKESQTGFNTFFKMNYAVANVEYRLSGQATAPAAVEDVRCALIYLIKNARALNIDTSKIVVMGGSAGGHLALMAGLLGNDHRFDNNCNSDLNIRVAAIVDKYGITNVGWWNKGPYKTSKSAAQWLGDKANDEKFAASVSPISYVNKNSPPVFIVHGDADPVVPYEHSIALKEKLDKAGVKNTMITVPGGQHGKFPKEKNSEINKAIADWLKELGII